MDRFASGTYRAIRPSQSLCTQLRAMLGFCRRSSGTIRTASTDRSSPHNQIGEEGDLQLFAPTIIFRKAELSHWGVGAPKLPCGRSRFLGPGRPAVRGPPAIKSFSMRGPHRGKPSRIHAHGVIRLSCSEPMPTSPPPGAEYLPPGHRGWHRSIYGCTPFGDWHKFPPKLRTRQNAPRASPPSYRP